MTEIWKICYEGPRVTYEVSNLGRVKKNGELITPIKRCGYYTISNYKYVHRAVAELFISNKEDKPEVDHIDGNRLNNNYTNLRWVTHKQNCNNPITRKRYSESMKGKRVGEKNPNWGKPSTIRGKHRVNHQDGTYHYENKQIRTYETN